MCYREQQWHTDKRLRRTIQQSSGLSYRIHVDNVHPTANISAGE